MALEGLRDLSRDRHRAAAAPGDQDLRAQREQRHDPRGRAARIEARRPGLLPAQRGRDRSPHRRDKLAELLPEARIAIAHGQMPERELERVMRDFVAQRHNVLLCSTIIETGIDVPTANTIVISRADKFGLAQLHQLRGRVGRSHHQAYAYLLVPDVRGPDQAGRAAARSDPADGGAGLGLLPRDARPRDPRRRRGAGREPERQHDGGRLPALQRHAGRGRALAEGRPRARPAVAAGGHHRDQPARAGPAARRLLRRRAHAPEPLQAPGHGRQARADRRPARRDHRPLRQAARPGPDAVRHAPPARAGQALRRDQDRRRARGWR